MPVSKEAQFIINRMWSRAQKLVDDFEALVEATHKAESGKNRPLVRSDVFLCIMPMPKAGRPKLLQVDGMGSTPYYLTAMRPVFRGGRSKEDIEADITLAKHRRKYSRG